MDIFEKAAKELPEGYILSIVVGKDEGFVEIQYPNGKTIDWHLDDATLLEEFEKAVDWCVEDSRMENR